MIQGSLLRGALAALLLLDAAPARAVVTDVTPEQIQEAVAHGKAAYERLRQERQPVDDLDPDYVVDLGAEVGRAMLFTEFSTVALEARRWLAIARDLKPSDVQEALAPVRGTLMFSVVLLGTQRDFLRPYTVRLVQGETTLAPARWDVHRGEPVSGARGRFVAGARYNFSAKVLDLQAPVTLVLTPPQGSEVRFSFDLRRLR